MWCDVTIPARALGGVNEYVWLSKRSPSFAYGLEVGSSGFLHYQCKVFVPYDAKTVTAMKLFYPFHWEESRSKEKDYVYKDGCYFDSDMSVSLELTQPQRAIQQFWIAEGDNSRSVCCIVDTTGCTGKSWYSMFLEDMCLAVRVPQMPADKIAGFLIDQPKYGRYVFDLTKIDGKKRKYVDELMSVIEELKNGQIADWRYKGRRWRYKLGKPVMVLVLCNRLPKSDSLSNDRWKTLYV